MKNKYSAIFGKPTPKHGQKMSFQTVFMTVDGGGQVPTVVKSGPENAPALLAIGALGESIVIYGSAFIVAPGVAISASHVFSSIPKTNALCAFSFHQGKLAIWKVESVCRGPADDACVICLSPGSEYLETGLYSRFKISTRVPKIGERITLSGFRETAPEEQKEDEAQLVLLTSSGQVSEIYPQGRDKVMVPFPCFEVDCGSFGGMSGGVALDENGVVLGVTSVGMTTQEHKGPTYVSFLFPALARAFSPKWPEGFYQELVKLIDLKNGIIDAEGLDAVKVLKDGTIEFTPKQ